MLAELSILVWLRFTHGIEDHWGAWLVSVDGGEIPGMCLKSRSTETDARPNVQLLREK